MASNSYKRKWKPGTSNPKLKNIFLDCGCASKEEVEKLGVHVGCVITYEDEFSILNNNYYLGRALDNRIGGFIYSGSG